MSLGDGDTQCTVQSELASTSLSLVSFGFSTSPLYEGWGLGEGEGGGGGGRSKQNYSPGVLEQIFLRKAGRHRVALTCVRMT